MSESRTFRDAVETREWAREFAPRLSRPAVVLLSGDLGAGKTQLVRWILSELGAVDVASPTYSIHHRYDTPGGSADHVDLYRVRSEGDLESSGFYDLLEEEAALVFVEWPDRLSGTTWPGHWLRIHIRMSNLGGERRKVDVEITPRSTRSGSTP